MAESVENAAPAADAGPERRLTPRWAVIGIFLLLCVQAIAIASSFLMPVVLALLLALIFSPVRRALSRMGVPAGVSAAAISTALLAGFLVLVLALAAPVKGWIDNAPEIGQEVEQKLRSLQGAAGGLRRAAEQVERLTGSSTPTGDEAPASAEEAGSEAVRRSVEDGQSPPEQPQRVVVEQPSQATALVLAAPGYAGQLLFTLILMFFLLASGDLFYEKIVYVIPRFRDKKTAIRIAYEIERRLSRYLATITTINFLLGVCVGVAFWALGMPSALLFAVLAFLLNYVPYAGAVMGIAFSVVVGVVTFPTVQQGILPGLVYFSLTAIEGQLVTPYFVGRSLRLNTVVVFLAVTFWAWLWSVVGMLVALPLLVALRTFCEHVPAMQGLGHFLSGRDDTVRRRDASDTPAEGEEGDPVAPGTAAQGSGAG